MKTAAIIIFSVTGFVYVLFILVGSHLYHKKGWFKLFYHDILGWHEPSPFCTFYDGHLYHTVCVHCWRPIMLDSQGNWFLMPHSKQEEEDK